MSDRWWEKRECEGWGENGGHELVTRHLMYGVDHPQAVAFSSRAKTVSKSVCLACVRRGKAEAGAKWLSGVFTPCLALLFAVGLVQPCITPIS